MLDVKDLSIRYVNSRDLALNAINFSANEGEFIVIAGPSGSGKSTLAKAILGIIPAFEEAQIKGNIYINNSNLANLTRKERIELLGYVPQYPSDFTTSILVEEEVAFKLENLGIQPEKINKLLSKILTSLGIVNLRNRLITEVSSGELQRVSLASALGFLPPIIILDEPIARIDPQAEVEISKILRKIANNGHIVLAFEHRLDYMLSEADKLIILDEGKKISDGKPKENLRYLKNIDPPEISNLDLRNGKHDFLTIEEALEILPQDLSTNTNLVENSLQDRINKVGDTIIRCENLSFRYSKRSEFVIEDVSFTIPTGQVVGLMGINGSGKSTLFKLISGILRPTSGLIYILDKKIKSAKKISKDLVFVPENAKLFLVGPTPLKDLERIWNDSDRARKFYTELGLNSLMNRKLYHLSEGQRRLFALINSFQLNNKIILLDEPTIALDRNGRQLLKAFLKQAKSDGKIVLIASNDPRLYPFFDRMIVLKDHKILFDDTPEHILYTIEDKTELIPNQIVRLIQQYEKKWNTKIPHFITVEEFNNYLRRDN